MSPAFGLVLDASVALSWIFERASATERARSLSVLDRLEDTSAQVPAIWPLEVFNALLVGERRQLNSQAESADFLERLSALRIEVDVAPSASRRDAVLGLARVHGLSAYDASYLELALRAGVAFATFDARLTKAAIAAGVAVV